MLFHNLVDNFDEVFGSFNENGTYNDWELGDSDPKMNLIVTEKSTDFLRKVLILYEIGKKYSAYSACS